MSIKVVVLGAGGRMGKALIRCIMEEKVQGLELFGAVDLWDVPDLGTDAGLMAGTKAAGINLITNLDEVGAGADVIVDFSSHFGTAGNASKIKPIPLAEMAKRYQSGALDPKVAGAAQAAE